MLKAKKKKKLQATSHPKLKFFITLLKRYNNTAGSLYAPAGPSNLNNNIASLSFSAKSGNTCYAGFLSKMIYCKKLSIACLPWWL